MSQQIKLFIEQYPPPPHKFNVQTKLPTPTVPGVVQVYKWSWNLIKFPPYILPAKSLHREHYS